MLQLETIDFGNLLELRDLEAFYREGETEIRVIILGESRVI